MPPEDFIFEELQPGMDVKATALRKTSRSMSTIDLNSNTNNYQRKRELEKKIGIHEIELAKGTQTYYKANTNAKYLYFSSERNGGTSDDD